MEARRRVEFTGGSSAVATFDLVDSAYYEVGGDTFVAAGIVGSTRSPCRQRRSPHHHRISRHAVDLVEGAARQSGTEACYARSVKRPPRWGAALHG